MGLIDVIFKKNALPKVPASLKELVGEIRGIKAAIAELWRSITNAEGNINRLDEAVEADENTLGDITKHKVYLTGSTLSQSMMPLETGQNTIYVVKDDLTLSEDVIVPANCVLEFEEGSIRGSHTLTGQNTGIKNNTENIFSVDLVISGSFDIYYFTPEMFIYSGSDVAVRINAAINVAIKTGISNVVLLQKEYDIETSIKINDGIYLGGLLSGHSYEYFVGTPVIKTENNIALIEVSPSPIVSHGGTIAGLRIENLQLVGSGKNAGMYGIYIKDAYAFGENNFSRLLIKNCRYCFYIANSTGIYNNKFRDIKLYNSVLGIYVEGKSTGNTKTTWMNHNLYECVAIYTMDIGGVYLKNMNSIQTNTFINCNFEGYGNLTTITDYSSFGGVFGVWLDGGANTNQFISCYFEGYAPKLNGEYIDGYLNNEKNCVFIVENGAGVIAENCIVSAFVNAYLSLTYGSIITKNNFYSNYLGGGLTGLFTLKNPAYAYYHLYSFDEVSSSLLNQCVDKIVKSVNLNGTELQRYQYRDIVINGRLGWKGTQTIQDEIGSRGTIIGPTSARPIISAYIGQCYFDTNLGKPIYVKEVDGSTSPITVTWVDATGQTV